MGQTKKTFLALMQSVCDESAWIFAKAQTTLACSGWHCLPYINGLRPSIVAILFGDRRIRREITCVVKSVNTGTNERFCWWHRLNRLRKQSTGNTLTEVSFVEGVIRRVFLQWVVPCVSLHEGHVTIQMSRVCFARPWLQHGQDRPVQRCRFDACTRSTHH